MLNFGARSSLGQDREIVKAPIRLRLRAESFSLAINSRDRVQAILKESQGNGNASEIPQQLVRRAIVGRSNRLARRKDIAVNGALDFFIVRRHYVVSAIGAEHMSAKKLLRQGRHPPLAVFRNLARGRIGQCP